MDEDEGGMGENRGGGERMREASGEGGGERWWRCADGVGQRKAYEAVSQVLLVLLVLLLLLLK